jgi:hypothetical protein
VDVAEVSPEPIDLGCGGAEGAPGKNGGRAVDESLRDDFAPADATGVDIPQYSIWQVLGVWSGGVRPAAEGREARVKAKIIEAAAYSRLDDDPLGRGRGQVRQDHGSPRHQVPLELLEEGKVEALVVSKRDPTLRRSTSNHSSCGHKSVTGPGIS